VKARCEAIRPGISVLAVSGDVSTEDGCKAIFEAAKNAFGRVDVLVNNAGQTKDGLAMRMSLTQFSEVIDINLTSAFMLSKLCLSLMTRQRKGRIINMSSVAGVYGNAGQVNYAASKAGIIGLTKSVAREAATRGITCNAIAPGFIETEMTDVLSEKIQEQMLTQIPLKRFGKAEEVANTAVFLSENTYITGQTISVNGGMYM